MFHTAYTENSFVHFTGIDYITFVCQTMILALGVMQPTKQTKILALTKIPVGVGVQGVGGGERQNFRNN